MKLITGPRASGKTTRAIALANEKNAHLVVRDHAQKKGILKRIEQDRIELINGILTHQEVLEGKHEGMYPQKIVIDEVGTFVQRVVGAHHVVAGTLTPDGQEILEDRREQ